MGAAAGVVGASTAGGGAERTSAMRVLAHGPLSPGAIGLEENAAMVSVVAGTAREALSAT